MRLINADAIQYREIWREDWLHNAGKYQQGVFRDEIEEMPTADAVPVVRCCDCKHYRKDGDCWHEWDNDGRIYYQSIINEPSPDDYCSRAERKEE